MKTLRIVSQIVFLLFFFFLFFQATYPLTSNIPVDFFLRLDPLLSISTAIAARNILIISVPAVIVILLTVVLGRFFCGWICPLGILIDVFDIFTTTSDKKRKKRICLPWIKFSLLSIIFISAILSIQLTGFLDPISLLTRSVIVFLYPVFVLFLEGFMGFFLDMGFLEDFIFNLYDILKGTLLPLNELMFSGFILISIMFLFILFAGILDGRFWCKNLCPLGGLLAIFSLKRLYKRKVSDDCTSCGLCEKICRMNAIKEDFVSTNKAECINCMDCMDVCPVNAVSFGFYKSSNISAKKIKNIDFNKRKFLKTAGLSIFTIGFLKAGFTDPVLNSKVIRPPGSLPEAEFLDRCIRCGECIKICSTSGAGLKPAVLEAGLDGLWSPILKPESGYCEYNCNLCGKVCPTGAIHELEVEKRQELRIGTAHFNKTRCIPWYYGENCMVCEEHCPLPDKAIKFITREVVRIDGNKSEVKLPYVDEILCIGCGICASTCPLEGERGIYVTNANEERFYQ
ncbi:MAG: 4Fe-4S binding protein [bacterium]